MNVCNCIRECVGVCCESVRDCMYVFVCVFEYVCIVYVYVSVSVFV